MQTRRSTRAAVAAASISTLASASTSAAAFAVTPSPPRKKPKTSASVRYGNGGDRENGRVGSGASDPSPGDNNSENSIRREEMRKLVLSHLNINNNSKSDINTNTQGGWCLIDALTHCSLQSNGILLPLIMKHGPPQFYVEHIQKNNSHSSSSEDDSSDGDDNDDKSNEFSRDEYKSFRSLCRVVSGQQLHGNAANAIWRRLLSVVDATEDNPENLTPESILSLVKHGDVETDLRAPAGLSNAKAKCIIAIAENFQEGTLSDDILLGAAEANNEGIIRSRLLAIKGLGQWSVDMFLLFQCHRSDILPIGDLAFRNGTSKLWGVKGKARHGGLCQKKDETVMKDLHAAFAPYRSVSSYFMYKCSGMKA